MTADAWNVVLGVVSGVLTSALVLFAGKVLHRVVIPWLQEVTYRGYMVDGEWRIHSRFTDQVGVLELRQRALSLTGTLTFSAKPDAAAESYEQIRTFLVVGRISDRFVEVSFRHTSRNRLGAGVLLLEVRGDGRTMVGVQAMYAPPSERITDALVVVIRPDFDADTALRNLDTQVIEEHFHNQTLLINDGIISADFAFQSLNVDDESEMEAETDEDQLDLMGSGPRMPRS